MKGRYTLKQNKIYTKWEGEIKVSYLLTIFFLATTLQMIFNNTESEEQVLTDIYSRPLPTALLLLPKN